MSVLKLDNVSINRADRNILREVSFTLETGDVLALEGQNGSGKTSLFLALAGHPAASISSGGVMFDGQNLIAMTAPERVKAGVLYLFQDPPALAGVKAIDFLRLAMSARFGDLPYAKVYGRVREELPKVGFGEEILERYVHDHFSGGEKKRFELLTMLLLEPKLILVDEIDAGLDADMRTRASELLCDQVRRGATLIVSSHQSTFLSSLPVTQSCYVCEGRVETPPCL